MLRFRLHPLRSGVFAVAAAVTSSVRTAASSSAGPPEETAATQVGRGSGTAKEGPEEGSSRALRPEDVLQAVRSGDINRIQDTATKLVRSQWREEYTLPVACAVVFVILWYWVAWTRRSVRRKCAAAEAAVRQEAKETVELIRGLTQKWSRDLAKSDEQMKAIIEKNSTLTADIDRMTTALRSCSIRPTLGLSARASRARAADPLEDAAVPQLPGERGGATSE